MINMELNKSTNKKNTVKLINKVPLILPVTLGW